MIPSNWLHLINYKSNKTLKKVDTIFFKKVKTPDPLRVCPCPLPTFFLATPMRSAIEFPYFLFSYLLENIFQDPNKSDKNFSINILPWIPSETAFVATAPQFSENFLHKIRIHHAIFSTYLNFSELNEEEENFKHHSLHKIANEECPKGNWGS